MKKNLQIHLKFYSNIYIVSAAHKNVMFQQPLNADIQFIIKQWAFLNHCIKNDIKCRYEEKMNLCFDYHISMQFASEVD